MATVALIGGGFSGAAIAFHLARAAAPVNLDILVFDPRERIGGGVAYDTEDPAHRINVPAAKMSLVASEEDHFLRWLEKDPGWKSDTEARMPDGMLYPRRSVFGRYAFEHVRPYLDEGRVRHVRGRVVRAERADGRWLLRTAGGAEHAADITAIVTSHPPPAPPGWLGDSVREAALVVADPHAPRALAAIDRDNRVLIVGTGLTMADIVASLDGVGHRGAITAISRRGQRSRGHGPWGVAPVGDFSTDPARQARALVRRVRIAVQEAEADGLTWHPVLDAVRRQGRAIWEGLPPSERRRLARHVRPFWDTHRFRVAPQVQAVVERRVAEGTLEVLAASVATASATKGGGVEVQLRRRRGPREARQFEAIVVTTGPAHATLLTKEPYLAGLARDGWIRADDSGLGIDCDAQAHAVDRDGRPVSSLFIGGPLARGTFGELMGLPEVSAYAEFVAEQIRSRACEPAARSDMRLIA